MKKITTLIATLALTLGFTACEDVPAPYEVKAPVPTVSLFEADFAGGDACGFTFKNVSQGSLSYVWKVETYNGSSYLKASAFNGAPVASESWAVSPAIDLSDSHTASLSFMHAINKIEAAEIPSNMTLWASADYAGDVNTATWKQLTIPAYPDGTNWNFIPSGAIDLKDFCGKSNVTLGFKYISSNTVAGTWEVNAIKIKGDGTPTTSEPGNPDNPENPGNPDTPVDPNASLIANGDFEQWDGNQPLNWKSACTASSATLSQSTEAHGGSYAVKLAQGGSQNKRLAYKELNLKAGSYTIAFWAKGAQARAGYVPVKDGTAGTYTYGGYVDCADWTQVTYNFDLSETTTVCLLVMNPKTNDAQGYTATDLLVDDFTLTTTNGGIADGGSGNEPEQPGQGGDVIFSEDFSAGLGAFTVDNVILPAGTESIWRADVTYQNANASAFIGGVSYKSEARLISPVIDLTGKTAASLSFEHTINKGDIGKMTSENTLWAREEGGAWKQVTITTYPAGNNWTYVQNTSSLSAYAGKKMQFSFLYKSEDGSSSNWQIKNLKVQ